MAGDDLGGLLGRLLGGDGGDGPLVAALLGVTGDSGQAGGNPLQGLVTALHDAGLGAKTDSWIGTGSNQSVSGPEIAQALPYQALDHVAQQGGVTPEQAADRLAEALPRVVDKLTPDGHVPEGSLEDLVRQRL
ncbi:YidB family protein [Streptomyces sp. NPDC049577]|uniref:YidB family protein n=1 Tax=Streptomyces sp. NPDC049577 TaxID=3155153 RepID=UPI00341AE386